MSAVFSHCKLRSWELAQNMKQTIVSIISPSGGTGKSTISKELAIAISSSKINGSNIKTCIIDADLNGGSQRTLFRIMAKYSIIDWINEYRQNIKASSGQDSDVNYTWEHIEKYLSYVTEYRLYLLPAPNGGRNYDVREKEMEAILHALSQYFDIIIIDTGNNVGAITLSSIKFCDTALLVVTDEMRSIQKAEILRRRLRNEGINLSKIRVVMNQCPKKPNRRLYSRRDVETILYLEVCVILPEEAQCWKYNNIGLPITKDKKNLLYRGLLALVQILVPEAFEK